MVRNSQPSFLLEAQRVFEIQEMFTSAYHPETNGQKLRKFVSEHPNTWDSYVDVLIYAYNIQENDTTARASFGLVLSRPPASTFYETIAS